MAKNCRSCNARVTWARIGTILGEKTEKISPFNIETEPPSDDPKDWRGRYAIDEDGVAWPYSGDHAFVEMPRYKAHFATCPDAERWRGGAWT